MTKKTFLVAKKLQAFRQQDVKTGAICAFRGIFFLKIRKIVRIVNKMVLEVTKTRAKNMIFSSSNTHAASE